MEIYRQESEDLLNEDVEMTLECADKIKGHLKRLINDEAKVKYVNNLYALNNMVSEIEESVSSEAIAV